MEDLAQDFTLVLVDDESTVREILGDALSHLGRVITFDSGEALLAAANDLSPDALLLDIAMPGLDGYATCRAWKQLEKHVAVPIIFVSAHDGPEDRLAAYAAGGDDFVDKHADPGELRIKVERSARTHRDKAYLAQFSHAAQSAAFAAMASMCEQGHVIQFLRESFATADYEQLAEALTRSLEAYGLSAAVQVRGQQGDVIRTAGDALHPLEAQVLESMAHSGRIIEFQSRAMINYAHSSLLIRNMPIDDVDKFGRLRDHLAIVAEAADARVEALDNEIRLTRQTGALTEALRALHQELDTFREINVKARFDCRVAMESARMDAESTLAPLALTEDQETKLLTMFQRSQSINEAGFERLIASDALMEACIQRLQQLTG